MSIQNDVNIIGELSSGTKRQTKIIDTDVHHEIRSTKDLLPYLPDQWKRYIAEYGWVPERAIPFNQIRKNTKYRMDSIPEDGATPGSNFQLLKEQLLDKHEMTHAVLTGWFYEATVAKGWYEFAVARASAYNDYTVEHWLEKDKRLLGSITIPRDPQAAVREIDRMAAHPQMAQVMLPIGDFAWGDPYFHPIFEAANRHGLPIAIHLSASITAQGGDFLRYYVAWRSLHPQAYMTQTISLITNGVFDKFPDLKVALVEGGFEWVPFMMHRMDSAYKALRQETPWVKRMPSDYFRDNLRFTTQPWDDLTAKEFLNIIDMMGSEDMIMYASDYPHWDFDPPERTLPQQIPDSLRQKILFENARNFYRL